MARAGIVGTIRSGSRRLRATLLAGVAVMALGVVALVLATGALTRIEMLSVDTRFEIRGKTGTPEDVVVVGIDDETFDLLTPSFPFPRGLHARVIDELRKAGAKVIAYDIQFTEPSPKGLEREDAKLFAAVERAGERLVLATTEVSEKGGTRVLGNDETRIALGAQVGNAVMPSDANGVVRKVEDRISRLATFAVVAARVADPSNLLPIPPEGAWIDFHGPPGTVPYASFGAVHAGLTDPELFRDKIVVVGAVAPSLQDVASTSASGDELMSGPEIQAEAIQTALDGVPLTEVPGWLEVVIAVLMTLVAPVAALWLRAIMGFVSAVLLAAAYAVGAYLLFKSGLILPVAVPILGLGLGAVGSLAALLVVEALERQRVRDVFSHFVPPSVVDDVLARAGSEVTLGGTSRECTLLFSDLRGFTSFSETRTPAEVIDILNDYLSEMTHAILDHGGTLISFMGDGIMALFGAPLDQPDHRDRAVEAAREMLSRLDDFNGRMSQHGLSKPFRMGIGINTGPVMCGNVGSERRLEYTAIGDPVNTASRIEGMTKETRHPVHVAASTVDGLERTTDLVVIGDLAVRGRESTIRLFGLAEYAPPATVTRFARPGDTAGDAAAAPPAQ
jgi:adenylate cyclase